MVKAAEVMLSTFPQSFLSGTYGLLTGTSAAAELVRAVHFVSVIAHFPLCHLQTEYTSQSPKSLFSRLKIYLLACFIV